MDESNREQQRERHDEFARERVTRGETRDAHLEGGRTQARHEAAQAQEQATAQPQYGENGETAQPEATLEERKAAAEAVVRAEARELYGGTDEEFERDWPAMREQLITEAMQKQRGGSPRRGGL